MYTEIPGSNDQVERAQLYHATTIEAWESIQRDGVMRSSSQLWDWLGEGVYFWQSAPVRAWLWKRCQQVPSRYRCSPKRTVVLRYEAEVEFGTWIDLLDVRWTAYLARTGAAIPELWRIVGRLDDGTPLDDGKIKDLCQKNENIQYPVPRYLDRAAIDYACRQLETHGNIQITAVRSAFTHLDQIYPHTALRYGDHVQVAIRRPEMIDVSKLEVVDWLEKIEPQIFPGLITDEHCVSE